MSIPSVPVVGSLETVEPVVQRRVYVETAGTGTDPHGSFGPLGTASVPREVLGPCPYRPAPPLVVRHVPGSRPRGCRVHPRRDGGLGRRSA